MGEGGDTDYEALLGGVHKTVILKGIGQGVDEHQAEKSYSLEDAVPFGSPNIVKTEGFDSNSIKASLGKIGVLKI